MATEFRANVSTIADVRQSLHRLKSLNIPTFTPDATRAPTSDDDYNRGYRVPSFWCRDSDRLYVCVDDTPNNAVWIEIAGSSVGIPITDIANAGDGVSLVASPSSSGSTFQLRGLLSGHTALSIAAAGADDVLFDLDESAIDHGGLGGRDDDDHSAYVLAEAPFAVQDNRLTRWDGTGGRDIQSSIVSISDTGVVDGALSYGLQNADRIALLDGDQLRWGDGAGTCHPLIIASASGAASVTLDPRNAGISDTGTVNLLGRTFNIGATAGTAVNIGQISGTAIRVGGLDGYVFGTGGVLSAAAAIPLGDLDLTGLDGAGLAFNGTALDAQVDGTTLEIVADVLQVVSGVYQPADATLDALAALTGAGVPQASGTDTWAMSTFAANRLVRGNSTTGLLENAGLTQAGDGALTPAALNTNLLLSGSGTGVVIVDDDLILNALIGAPGTARKLRLEEGDFNETYVQLSAPQSVPVTFTLTFPAALPGATQFVNCTAAGQLGFADLDSGDIPDLSGTYVPHSLFDANTILKADSDNTPVALTVGEQTLVGRITAGSIAALTATEARTLLNVADGANAYVHPNHTGDVTSVADGATTIANDAVTTIKILNANVTLDKIVEAAASSVLLGSGDAGVGIPYAEITLGTNLSMSGTTLNASGGGYTDEQAQDAVGGILVDSTEIDFTYADATPSITASLLADSVVVGKLHATQTDVFFGRDTAAAGAGEEITASAARTLLNVADGANAYVHPNHSGDVTSVADGTTTIAANAVRFAQMDDIPTDSLIGRDSPGTGDPQVIGLSSDLEFNGTNAIRVAAFTGDVTKAAGGTVTTIANDAVTTIKILDANVTLDKIVEAAASSVLLGSGDAGVGIPYAEITLGTNLSMSGTTLNASGGGASALDDLTDVTITLASAGDLLRHNGTAWVDDVLVAGDIPDLSATYSVVGHDHSGVYQPLDADLTAIAALDGPGVLVASGADTWAIQNPLTVASGGTGLATITADRLVTGAGTSALNITDFSLASGVIERTAAGAATLRAAAGSVSTFGRDEEGNIEVGPSAVTGTEYGIVPAVDGAVRPFHLGTTAKRFGEIHAYSLISLDADGDGSTVGTSFWGATQDAFAYWNNTDSVFTLGPAVQIDNLKLDGNTISATDTNGNVDAALAGTGNFRVTSGSVITNISALTCELNRSTRVRVGSLTTGATGNEVLASLATSTTSTPSNGTTETTIASASLAANAFTGSEGVAVFHATGTATGSAPTKTFRVKVGGTTILDTGALSSMGAGSPGDWFVELRLWRTSATAYKYVAEFTTSDGSASLVEYFKKYGTGTVTNWTSANTIAVTVQFSAAGTDVTGEASLLVYEGRTTT